MFRYGNSYKADPRHCVISIAWQLSTQLHEYQQKLAVMNLEKILTEANTETLFDSLVLGPLTDNFPKPDRMIVVLIDALDEAGEGQTNKLVDSLTGMLDRMPAWFRMIVTSRPGPPLSQMLKSFNPFDMDSFEAEIKSDMHAHLSKHLASFCKGGAVPENTVNTIIKNSQGTFLYVQCILTEVSPEI